MAKLQLSPWFSAKIKPVRKGIYLREVYPGEEYYFYWNGKYWEFGGWRSIEYVQRDKRKSYLKNLKWRGAVK